MSLASLSLQVGGSGSQCSPPSSSLLAGNLQLLAVEWTQVTSTSPLTLQLNSVAVTIDLSSMLLPLQIVPAPVRGG